ncbi:MAG TPA: hypothetical protein VJQ45_09720 [Ktedonobacterales bacterium]|nr:hypothetical protein [Ktedonobacterales bacterium]
MAEYTVLSVDVRPPCAAGRRHVAKASLMVDRGAAGVAPIVRLLEMAASGDTFVVGPLDPPGRQAPARFVRCACGDGYLLEPDGRVEEYAARS